MALTAAQQSRLDEIDAIIQSGVSQAQISGRSISYDIPSLRLERDSLRALSFGVPAGSRYRRVVLTDG